MTWNLPLSLAQLRRAWRVFATTAPLIGILAGVGFIALPAPDPQPKCASIFASALSSPDRPIAGSYRCQTAFMQMQATLAGYPGDEGIQAYAQEEGYTGAVFIGSTGDGGWLYEVGGDEPRLLVVWLDDAGRVKGFGTATAP
jgi:hypothetical protein